MYHCQYFDIKELVGLGTYAAKGELAWRFFNPGLLRTADTLRDIYGPMFINTWSLSEDIKKAYGDRTESGLRIPGMDNYKPYSSHSHANAFDAVFRDVSAEQIRRDILANKIELPPLILECTIGGEQIKWLHFAVGNIREHVELRL